MTGAHDAGAGAEPDDQRERRIPRQRNDAPNSGTPTQDGSYTRRIPRRHTPRGWLVSTGLPRDPSATRNLTGFVGTAVVTVLVTRAWLAAAGYPQVGGGGLHIAHVLWGGLGMALAVLLLLSYMGPAVRPAAALVGGVGFGLFIDEIGKFVTTDHDYFYQPTAALIYGVVVAIVLLGEVMHGRRAHHPAEFLAAATDRAVAGLAGGFSANARADAQELVSRGRGAQGSAQVQALVDAVPASSGKVVDLIAAISSRIERLLRRSAAQPRVATSVGWLLIVCSGAAVVVGAWSLINGWRGGTVPAWMSGATMAAGAICLLISLRGRKLAAVTPHRAITALRGVKILRRAALLNLLVTQILVFRILEWPAVVGAVLNLASFAILEARVTRAEAQGLRVPPPEPFWSRVRRFVAGGVVFASARKGQ